MNKLTLFLGGVALGACGYGLKKWYDKQCQKEQSGGVCDIDLNKSENITKDEENLNKKRFNKESAKENQVDRNSTSKEQNYKKTLNEEKSNDYRLGIDSLLRFIDRYLRPTLQELENDEFLKFKEEYTDNISYDLKNVNLKFKNDLEEIIKVASDLRAFVAFQEFKNNFYSFPLSKTISKEIHQTINNILEKQK